MSIPAWIIDEIERKRGEQEEIGIQLPLPLYEYPPEADTKPQQDPDYNPRVIIIEL